MMQKMLTVPAQLFLGKGIIDKKFPFLLSLYKKVFSVMAKKGEVKVIIPLGLKLLVSGKDCGLGMYLRTKREFEPEQTKLFLDALKPGMVVVDIGANIGYYTVLASKLVGKRGKVFAFEPDPNNLKLLKKNLEINEYRNVEVIAKAVGDKKRIVSFNQDLANPGESSLTEKIDSRAIKMGMITLDGFLRQKKVGKVDVLKIDVEGAELKVLEGAKSFLKRAKNLKIFVEANTKTLTSFGNSPKVLVKKLAELGFEVELIINEFKRKRLPFTWFALEKNLEEANFVNLVALKKTKWQLVKKPLVTVLMTAYNAQRFVKEAVESIINQTYQNLEILIVDDGSKDRTFEVLKSLASLDKRIRLYRLKKNLGPSLASNFGVDKAKGEFIARMDADDIALPDRIERQVKFLQENPEAVMVGGQCNLIDENGQQIGVKKFPLNHKDIYNSLFAINPIQHPACMINRKLLLGGKIHYHNHFLLAHDLELIFELAQYGKLANLPEIVLNYRLYPGSLSLRNPKKTFRATIQVRKKAVKKYGYRPSLKGRLLNLSQRLLVGFLPGKMTFLLFALWRGIRPVEISIPDFSFLPFRVFPKVSVVK